MRAAYNVLVRPWFWIAIACAGCSFDPQRLSMDGGGPAGDDQPPGTDGPAADPPFHLDPNDGIAGTDPLSLSGNVTIDTGDTPTINGVTLPAGDSFDIRSQLGGGPDLAVLHVGSLDVANGAVVTVVGSHPFVIVAGGDVTIGGVLDAGAHNTKPGPGGAMAGSGDGAGSTGSHGSNDSDSGGGGGGYGETGARGGNINSGCTVDGGNGGNRAGDRTITQLVGGAGGGSSSGTACNTDLGGAGGGAIQISSATRIAIDAKGAITAGGGGGSGGTDCGDSDVNSGTGGGSGGSIVLQAPAITNAGAVVANGGGGGGSSSTGNGDASPGEDGRLDIMRAKGGTGPRATGGDGGVGGMNATNGGGASCGGNGAGGGGGVGRIAVSSGYADSGTTSPSPDTSL